MYHASVSIAIPNSKRNRTIYVNSKVSLSELGAILLNHYTSPESINELLDHGDAYYIGKSIGEKIDYIKVSRNKAYADEIKDQCRFYHRDDGARLVVFDDLTKSELGDYTDYNYRYVNGDWYVSCRDTRFEWEYLESVVPASCFELEAV